MQQVNKQAIAAAFGRAARSYERHDGLQRQSARGLLALLGEGHFERVLDAGCGPGGNSRWWRSQGSHVTAMDLSAPMLEQARSGQAADDYLLADIEAIPLADAGFDLVWSHLAVQWCASLPQALAEILVEVQQAGLIAQALAPKVRVVGVAPGITMVSGDQSEQGFAAAHQMTPLRRSSTPQDIADAVVYAASARALTGTTLLVDGGQHLMPSQRDVMFLTEPNNSTK